MITKQAIKNYLDFSNKELAEKLKSTIENSENWSDFQSDLIDLLLTYDQNPNPENKAKIDNLISRNYTNTVDAKDALNKILGDLHIGQEKSTSEISSRGDSKSEESEIKKLYESLGLEYDIVGQSQENAKNTQVSSKDIEKFRKQFHSEKQFFKAKSDRTEENGRGNKKDGIIKRTLKLVYFKLTASMLNAPGKVPPEILSKNKDLIDKSSEKLDTLIENLKENKKAISNENQIQEEKFDDDIKVLYEKMINGEFDEKAIKDFKGILNERKDKQLGSIRNDIINLIQDKKLEDKFRIFAEENFPNMPKEELEEEIKYALLDSKIDKNGKLVLPQRSLFKDVLYDENGEIQSDKLDIVNTIKTNCEFLKVKDLSNQDIEDIAKDFKEGKDQSILDEASKAMAFRNFLSTHADLVSDDFTNIISNILETYDEYNLTKNLSEETEITHKIMLSEEINRQFLEIKDIVKQYDDKEQANGTLSRDDSKKRELALKIARRKVNSLEKAKLSKVIEQGDNNSKAVITRARGILLPHLENARNKDSKKFEKNFGQQEH